MLTAEIDLGAIKDNAFYIKKRVKTEAYAVVKADAYGHGAVRVAKHIENIVDGFAVATDFEALELTNANIKKPILVLETELSGIKLPKNVIASVATPEQIRAVKNVVNGVHIVVNSGMNRLGCKPSEIIELLKVADRYGVSVEGAFTHFYNEHNSKSCAEQFDEFLSGVLPLRNRIRRLHCCASNCLILPSLTGVSPITPRRSTIASICRNDIFRLCAWNSDTNTCDTIGRFALSIISKKLRSLRCARSTAISLSLRKSITSFPLSVSPPSEYAPPASPLS